MLAVAIHCQMLAFQEVLLQVTPETSPREISRISMHTSFDQFTRTRALAIALLTTELDEVENFADRIANEGGLISAPGLAAPFDRHSEGWGIGRLQALTMGFFGTVLTYSRMLITLEEAHASLDHIVDAAWLLGPETGAAAERPAPATG